MNHTLKVFHLRRSDRIEIKTQSYLLHIDQTATNTTEYVRT